MGYLDRASFRNSFDRKLADSSAGVAPNRIRNPYRMYVTIGQLAEKNLTGFKIMPRRADRDDRQSCPIHGPSSDPCQKDEVLITHIIWMLELVVKGPPTKQPS